MNGSTPVNAVTSSSATTTRGTGLPKDDGSGVNTQVHTSATAANVPISGVSTTSSASAANSLSMVAATEEGKGPEAKD